ncbi:MAG: glycoside hydrolase family 2, partial [Acidobacteriota bacterium]
MRFRALSLAALSLTASSAFAGTRPTPSAVVLAQGWQLQYSSRVTTSPATLSSPAFAPTGWLPATVPGTVLTTLVNNHIYPEPLYGENDRPEVIPDTLARES